MNPMLKRLLGETLEDPVEHHLKTVGAGVPPAGRTYPEMPHERPQGHAAEEAREVKIGKSIKEIIENGYATGLGRGWSQELDQISALADELIQMHTKPSA